MTEDQDRDLPGGWEAGAAEYALGLMPATEIDAFEARLAAEVDLQQDVAAWTEYFATFTDLIPAETPPTQLQRRIEARIFGSVKRRPIWLQVVPYGIGAVAGGVIAWLVFASDLLEPARPALQGELSGASANFSARYDPSTGVLSVDGRGFSPPEGRSVELWLRTGEGGDAISLALLRGPQTLVALPPALQRDLDGARLWISEEPAGGAPDGTPSGEALAQGNLAPE